MSRVGAYEAKTRLSELLDAVEAGERITITRHGRAVAVLIPAGERDAQRTDLSIAALRELRRGKRLGGGLREAIEEGRR